MINIKHEALEKVENWSDNSIHILTDFDRTITVGGSDSSWSILANSNLVPKEYVEERQALYDHYRPYEIDESLDDETKNKLMYEWWDKHINLIIKYKFSETIINEAARNSRVMKFRSGAKEFLENMRDRNIPVIMISAGIGNFIEQFLKNNECNFDNIYIVSNFIKFENGIAVGVLENNVIHSLNKNEVSLPEEIMQLVVDRPNIILLGDSVSDTKMAQEEKRNNALKIGFLEEKVEENRKYFEDQFDLVCTDNTDYNDLSKVLPILRRK